MYSISKSVYIKIQKVRDDLLSRNGGQGNSAACRAGIIVDVKH
jgi:hypothetical protein